MPREFLNSLPSAIFILQCRISYAILLDLSSLRCSIPFAVEIYAKWMETIIVSRHQVLLTLQNLTQRRPRRKFKNMIAKINDFRHIQFRAIHLSTPVHPP